MKKQFNPQETIDLIIDNTLLSIYNKDQSILLSENKTYDELKQELKTIYNTISKYNLLNNSQLYEDYNYFKAYHELLFESITTGTLIGVPVLALLAITKLPGKIVESLEYNIYRLSKFLSKKTEDAYLINYFLSNIKPDCIKELRRLSQKIPLSADEEQIRKIIKHHITNPVFGITKTTLKRFYYDESKFVICTLEYLIQLTGLELSVFYKCLFDNKQFLDLIKLKKSAPDILLNIDKFNITQLINLKSTCREHYKIFQDTLKNTTKLIDLLITDNQEKERLYNELQKAISKANEYAQKLLDEGKKKRDNNSNNNKR